jgi:hypothetical protein
MFDGAATPIDSSAAPPPSARQRVDPGADPRDVAVVGTAAVVSGVALVAVVGAVVAGWSAAAAGGAVVVGSAISTGLGVAARSEPGRRMGVST